MPAPLHRLVSQLGGNKSRKPSRQVLAEAWTDICEESFEELKQRLVLAPVLEYVDFTHLLILEVDASYGSLRAMLSQKQNGMVRPSECNMNNCSSKKLEFLVLKWALTE